MFTVQVLPVTVAPVYVPVTLKIVTPLLILLAIRCVFFESTPNSKKNDSRKDGILIENESGKLMVTRETLENLANSVVKGFENVENIASKVELDKDNNVSVYVSFAVKPNAAIKELSANLQTRIKETIKSSLELEVKEVNIRIKNVTPKLEAMKEE